MSDLARLLVDLLDTAPASPSRAERRARARLRSGLEAVAADPIPADAFARRLAGTVVDATPIVGAGSGTVALVPGIRTWRNRVEPPTSVADIEPDDRATSRRRTAALAAGAMLGVGVVVATMAAGGSSPSDPMSAPAGLAHESGAASASTDETPPAVSPPAPVVAPGPTPTVATFGHVVGVDGVWFAVGSPGDIVRVGDWRCDGRPTAAVLRPPRGQVFLFGGWAAAGERLRATAVIEVPGTVDLVSAGGDPCPTLLALGADGSRVPVEVVP